MLTHHVKHYLEFIDGGINTYAWMNKDSTKVLKGRSSVHGKFGNVQRWYKDVQREGEKLPTLHMALNATDLNGRRRGNIKAYRVLCCDLDRHVKESELLVIYKKYKVHLVVQSSPGKYHLYWKLERGSDLDTWKSLQLGMASRLAGDLQLSLPTSMIRVPGFARIDKNGNQIMPSVMTFAAENKIAPLTIKQIVKMWPWIWEESKKGEDTLLSQRREAARIARELMRARGTSYDGCKFARMTPTAGRNNTLYLTVSDIVCSHEETLTFEEALSFGEEVNEAFTEGLESFEVEKTVNSAWTHGLRVRKSRAREKRALMQALEKGQAAETKKETRAQKREKKAQVSEIIVRSILGTHQPVPESYLDISDMLVERIWTEEGMSERKQAGHHNILASAYKTKYYKKLTDFLVRCLKVTGAFKVSGYSVYLRGVNASGEPVRYRKNLDSESLSALIQDILSRLYLYTVKVSLNGKEDGGGGGGGKESSLVSYLEQGKKKKPAQGKISASKEKKASKANSA